MEDFSLPNSEHTNRGWALSSIQPSLPTRRSTSTSLGVGVGVCLSWGTGS